MNNNKISPQTILLLILSLLALGAIINGDRISSWFADDATAPTYYNDALLNVPVVPTWQNTYHYGAKDNAKTTANTYHSDYPAHNQNQSQLKGN